MPAEKQDKPEQKSYVQPKAFVGEFVYWSHSGSNEKLLGLVTSVTPRMVNVELHADGQPGTRVVRGARHVTDPDLKTMVEAPGGVWQHTEYGSKIHALLD